MLMWSWYLHTRLMCWRLCSVYNNTYTILWIIIIIKLRATAAMLDSYNIIIIIIEIYYTIILLYYNYSPDPNLAYHFLSHCLLLRNDAAK